MKINTQRLLAVLVMVALFASCSRPVAYFQKSPREHFAVAPTATALATSPEAVAPETPVVAIPVQATTPSAQIAQATTALDQMDAMVRNDSKLATDKTVQKRLNRIRTLLAATPATSNVASSAPNTVKKMNLMERLMLKKMNKKINKQLAPNNPNKAMSNGTILTTGAVVVIIGLILYFATSATGLGFVVLLAGAIILLVGLL